MRTRFITVFTVFAVVVLILAAQLGAFQAQETSAIPLDTAYVSFNQEGIKSLDNTVDNATLGQIVGEIKDGPQQIVLCVGDDVAAAVKASVLGFSKPEDAAPTVRAGTIDTWWLAAYLGSDGSTPPAYRVETIEVKGKTIRVAYERDESPARSADLLAYLVWVPVGRLEAGVYTLELFDAVAGNVTASRPWHVFVE